MFFRKTICLSVFLFMTCSSDPFLEFRKVVESCRAGEVAASRVNEQLMRYAVLQEMGSDVELAGDIPVERWSDRVEILYPEQRIISCENAGSMKYFALSGGNAVASDGRRIIYFEGDDETGREIVQVPGEKESYEIRAVALSGDRVFYYSDGRVWYSDAAGKERGVFGRDKFPPPYGQFYTVVMTIRGNDLAILSGLAGSYNFSVIDIATGKNRLKKWTLASRRFLLADNEVRCVRGGSGNWRLVKSGLPAGEATVMERFSTINDIVLFPGGYLYRKKGSWHLVSGEGDIVVPFVMEVAGSDEANLYIRADGLLRRIDFERFRNGLVYIRETIPDFPGIQ